ncbi:MAG: zf-HC2 domain-containing protein [Gemmatimonadetes bacterium]|nr:zf-HC2 domain-containing protein [Gemmatimonadota bacterium]
MSERHMPADLLHDHIDGLLDATAERAVVEHLARCPECAAEADALRALRTEAGTLPASLDPGVDLRPAIRAEVARRTEARRAAEPAGWERRLPGRGRLAAAAVLVVCAGALTTVLVRGMEEGAGAEMAAAAAGDAETTVLALDREYARAADELRTSVDAATARLPAGTARLLRGNVAAVERALAESRTALLQDPSSPVLRELVLTAHRRRLDVLRQAAAIAAYTEEAT